MTFNNYFDEEYFQIQEFLYVLSDTLPKIDLEVIPDTNVLIEALIDQNKAYGRKIISLYETLDSVYKSSTPLEASPGLGSPDFNHKLHQKILDYEDLVKKLTSENEGFSTQIKQLSQQIDSLKTQSYGNHNNNSGKKSVTIVTSSPSPLTKSGGGTNNAFKEISFELEHLFTHAEYKKAVELLGQIDYKKPLNVASEKFNSWLIIANRMKDTSFNDILNKLKILLTFADRGDDDDEPVAGLDDSLDRPSSTVAEKIYTLLDERIPKVILRNEYKIETKKLKEKSPQHFSIPRSPSEKGDEDSMLTKEQLQMKVNYLNAKVEQMERNIQDKSLNSPGLTKSMFRSPDKEYSQNMPEDLYQELQQEIDKRIMLENQTREVVEVYEDLKEKYDGLLRDVSEYDAKCQELSEQLKDNGDFIDRLMQENASLKEQCEFSEKLEDIEKIQELLQEKDLKIKSLSDEINLMKDSQKSPQKTLYSDIKKILNDTPSAQKETNDLRNQISLEIALQAQSSTLDSVQQILSNLKSPLSEILSHFKLELPSRKNSVTDINDGLENPSSEAQKILKENNLTLKEVLAESEFIKIIATNLQNNCAKTPKPQEEESNTLPASFSKRIVQAEEKLFENLSNSIQIVSQLTSLLSGTATSNQVSSNMPQIHQVLQNLHTNLASTIQEYPDFGQEVGGPQSPFKELQGKSQQLSTSFKDKLIQDQSDLKTKLKSTLHNIESYQTSEIYQKLYQEIDRNVELQELLDAKDMAIHRLNLIFNEGIERSNRSLEQLAKLADSDEAQGLLAYVLGEISTIRKKIKEIVDTNKSTGWKLDDAIVKAEGEYDLQKNSWLDTIKDLEEENETRIRQLIREIEGEREAHERTRNKLMDAQEDVMSTEKVTRLSDDFRREIHGLNEKLREKDIEIEQREREYETLRKELRSFEKERGGILSQVERLKDEMNQVGLEKGRLREDLVRSGGEKEEIRKHLEEIIREVEVLRRNTAQKNGEIEQLLDEVRSLKQENQILRDDLSMFKNDFEDLENGFEKARNENKHLLQQTNEGLEKKQREVEALKRRIDSLERENEDLREHKTVSETKFKESNQHVDHLKLTYFNDITSVKEENRNLIAQKKQISADLEKKTMEIAKLNQMIDSLQEFSNKQLETIREREDKIHILSNQKREMEQYIREVERKMEEVTEKNKKYSDSISQNSSDVQILKVELHELMDKHAALQRDLIISRQNNEELAHKNLELTSSRELFSTGKSALEDKVRKMNEINQITKNELKNCRDLLEERNREIIRKDQEIQELKEQPRRDREGSTSADIVARLRKEIEARGAEIFEMKKDFRKSLEKNEKLNIEIEALKAANRMGDQKDKEVDRINDLNRTMTMEIDTLRKSIKQRDSQLTIEKENYEREIQLAKRKITDLQDTVELRDKQIKNMPKSLGDSLKSSGGNASTGGSSYYNSLIESKDLEIKRLTQIVKNLTENLRDTQESKYKLRK